MIHGLSGSRHFHQLKPVIARGKFPRAFIAHDKIWLGDKTGADDLKLKLLAAVMLAQSG